jgi:glycosyltransferase involved in cell wall biosynthesis
VVAEDDIYEGIAVRRLSFNQATVPDPFRWQYDNTWIGDDIQKLFDETPPDIFHLIGGYLISARPLEIAFRRGIPTVVTLTDFWFLCPRISMLRSDGQVSTLPVDAVTCARCLGEENRRYRLPGRIAPGLMKAFWRLQKAQIHKVEARQSFLRQMLNQVNVVISPSHFLRSTFVEAGVDPQRIIFLRQGQDFPYLRPEIPVKTFSPPLRIGYVGQIVWHKGVHVLLEAVRRMPGALLTVRVFGDTDHFPDYSQHLRWLSAKDDRIELAGVYGRREVSRVLRGLDVIVVPSLWYENSPNVILEAFAHHVPVIASGLGGMAELVNDGENGLLFKPGDPDSLAQQLRRLLEDPHLLPKLRAGIRPVKRLAQEIRELEEIYQRVALTADIKSRISPR